MNCESAIITRDIPISDRVCAYVDEYHKERLVWILSKFSVAYQLQSEGDRCVLRLIGQTQNVTRATPEVATFFLNLTYEIEEEFLDLPESGDLDFFMRLADQRITRSMQVLLLPRPDSGFRLIGHRDQLAEAKDKLLSMAYELLGPKDQLAQAKDKLLSTPYGLGLSKNTKPRLRTEFTTALGTDVSIVKGDLVLQDTDVIVNPANERLLHNGGAAKAIADAAGPQLNYECKLFVRDHGPLVVSQVMHTTSGRLFPRILHVLHAVGPRADMYPDQTDQYRLLEETFFNCLSYANDELNAFSISIPAISSGIFGISKDLVALTALSGLHLFEAQNCNRKLRTVRFVNIDDGSTQSFLRVFRRQSLPLKTTTQQGKNGSRLGPTTPPRSLYGLFEDSFEEETMPATSSDDNAYSQKTDGQPIPMATDDTSSLNTRSDLYAAGNGFQFDDNGMAIDAFGAPCAEANGPKQPIPSSVNLPAVPQRNWTAPEREIGDTPQGTCFICSGPMTDPTTLPCGHKFCKGCINDSVAKSMLSCPSCGAPMIGVVRGNQPPGTMKITVMHKSLPGCRKYRTLVINYIIPHGIQDSTHPHPGEKYYGTQQVAYLPDSREGREVCDLLRKAFEAGLVFTIGRSPSTGLDIEVVWGDIQHKTSFNGMCGYPDPDYFTKVKEQLKAKGIVPTPIEHSCILL